MSETVDLIGYAFLPGIFLVAQPVAWWILSPLAIIACVPSFREWRTAGRQERTRAVLALACPWLLAPIVLVTGLALWGTCELRTSACPELTAMNIVALAFFPLTALSLWRLKGFRVTGTLLCSLAYLTNAASYAVAAMAITNDWL